MNLEEKVQSIAEKETSSIGITVKKVEYVKEDNMYFLRIYIDKEPFITVDDCVAATKAINPILDKEDIIKGSYILDVCSYEKEGN